MPIESQALKSPINTSIVAYAELDNDMVWVCPENPLPVRIHQEDYLATEQTLQSVDMSLNYIETNTGDLLIKVDSTNTYLSSLNNKLPVLSSGRVPVEVGSLNITLDNAQLEIANDSGNPIPVTIQNAGLEISNDTGNPIPITGTVAANTGLSQPLTDTQLRASNVSVALGVSLPTGYNVIGSIDSIVGTVVLPTGASTSANQIIANNYLSAIDEKLGGTLGVYGPLTDSQLRATPVVQTPHANPSSTWQVAAGSAITNTTSVSVATAAATLRNYLTGLQIFGTNGTGTVVNILDNTTVIWAGYAYPTTSGLTGVSPSPAIVVFPTPLRGSVNTAMYIKCATSGASVWWSAQGYTGT